MSALVTLSVVGAAADGLVTGDPDTLAALGAAHATHAVDVLLLGGDTDAVALDVVRLRVDPLTTVVARHTLFPCWTFLVVAVPARDHPYNLARRVLSAAHLTADRIGVALAGDPRPGAAVDHASTDDAATAIRALWRSWPAGTIVGDRATGVYADVSGVHAVDRRGTWRIAGPLGTPATLGGDPVLGSWDRAADGAEFVVRDGLLTVAGTAAGVVHEVRSAADIRAIPGRAALVTEVGPRPLRSVLGLPPSPAARAEGHPRA